MSFSVQDFDARVSELKTNYKQETYDELQAFVQHPNAYQYVETILKDSSQAESKQIACRILNNFCDTRWAGLDPQTKDAIRYYVLNYTELRLIHPVVVRIFVLDAWSELFNLLHQCVSTHNSPSIVGSILLLIETLLQELSLHKTRRYERLRQLVSQKAQLITSIIEISMSTMNEEVVYAALRVLRFAIPYGSSVQIDGIAGNAKIRAECVACLTEMKVVTKSIMTALTTDFNVTGEELRKVQDNERIAYMQNVARYIMKMELKPLEGILRNILHNSIVYDCVILEKPLCPLINESFIEPIILNITRPREVLVTQDGDSDVVYSRIEDEHSTFLYEASREYLQKMSRSSLYETLISRVTPGEGVNAPACWVIGALYSGESQNEEEDEFFIHVLKRLLEACESSRSKNEKAQVASAIMYVVSKYIRFLRENQRFCRVVVFKLVEFMSETFEGVKEMAIETLLSVSKSVSMSFVDDLISVRDDCLSVLSMHQACTFFEALAYACNEKKLSTALSCLRCDEAGLLSLSAALSAGRSLHFFRAPVVCVLKGICGERIQQNEVWNATFVSETSRIPNDSRLLYAAERLICEYLRKIKRADDEIRALLDACKLNFREEELFAQLVCQGVSVAPTRALLPYFAMYTDLNLKYEECGEPEVRAVLYSAKRRRSSECAVVWRALKEKSADVRLCAKALYACTMLSPESVVNSAKGIFDEERVMLYARTLVRCGVFKVFYDVLLEFCANDSPIEEARQDCDELQRMSFGTDPPSDELLS